MQLFILVLFVGIFMEQALTDVVVGQLGIVIGPWPTAAIVGAPKALAGILYAICCRWTFAALSKPAALRRLRWLDRIGTIYRVGILTMFLVDIALGTLWRLRELLPVGLLLPELLLMMPPLGMLVWGWWAYYPIDRRLRDAQLLGRIDQGLPISQVWSRGQYIVSQFRYQIALVFVPLVSLLALWQLIELFLPDTLINRLPFDLRPVLQMCGAGCIFLFAPVMLRHIWDTIPLPHDELRQRLVAMCDQYRVGVRELLVWQTFGGIVNAAVMGLVRPLRYILLSDGLLEMLPLRHVEAVMAHELAHVHRRHMVWLLVTAFALLLGSMFAATSAVPLLQHLLAVYVPTWSELLSTRTIDPSGDVAAIASILCWFIGFGWISRRFERQADTFAVQHLTIRPDQSPAATPCVDQQAADTMIEALEQVARLNHMEPSRRSWRHGSIRWRQSYLRSLVGRPINQLSVDRQVFWIKFAAAVVFVATFTVLAIPTARRALMPPPTSAQVDVTIMGGSDEAGESDEAEESDEG